jgi:hypothetical protein
VTPLPVPPAEEEEEDDDEEDEEDEVPVRAWYSGEFLIQSSTKALISSED